MRKLFPNRHFANTTKDVLLAGTTTKSKKTIHKAQLFYSGTIGYYLYTEDGKLENPVINWILIEPMINDWRLIPWNKLVQKIKKEGMLVSRKVKREMKSFYFETIYQPHNKHLSFYKDEKTFFYLSCRLYQNSDANFFLEAEEIEDTRRLEKDENLIHFSLKIDDVTAGDIINLLAEGKDPGLECYFDDFIDEDSISKNIW